MKAKKFKALVDNVSEYIANNDMVNHHYLLKSEIIAAFQHIKKKHVKKAIKEVR